ncbi:hypothetical protein BDV10DRAFT_182922 [Aspergillus recurvatus]
MPHTQSRDYCEERRKLQRQVGSQEKALRGLRHDIRSLEDQASEAQKQHLADTEKIQQQEQLLRQAREDASRREEEQREQVNQLYSKLNSVQAGQRRLTDEEVKERLRRLVQNLESWIKANFRDTAKLAPVIDQEGILSTSPLRRAWIQSYVANSVQHHIFSPAVFGVPPNPWGQLIQDLDAGVQRTSPELTLQAWRTATARALNDMSTEEQKAIVMSLVDHIEEQFAAGSTSETGPRRQQLQTFLERCAMLKNGLTQDPDEFFFFTSAQGADFSEKTMISIGGEGESGGRVKLSLWPALYRRTTGPERALYSHSPDAGIGKWRERVRNGIPNLAFP